MSGRALFRKVLVANRGEIAVRLIRGCRDLDISPVAVYSEADREALHVRMADEAYCIGPAPSSESYLRIDRIVDAARQSGSQAVHPGYGFLAENAAFARACEAAGLVFIGPSPDSIDLMGDKIRSRRIVQEAGVPVVPGSPGPVESLDEAIEVARRIGFPVMLKASAGGGGKGLRLVSSEPELRSAYRTAKGEAESAFGDATIFLEKYIDKPRHIEVQVLGDRHGRLIHLGERECSIQRRHQKVVEECPSPVVDAELRQALGRAALAAAQAVDYYNAGTVEFLFDASTRHFYFLEMNTRLQVEHPVTEMVTGVDLVQEQIRIAAGHRLDVEQDAVIMRGAAIECRIYAEDPENHFYPSPGLISGLFEPAGPGIRNDSGVYAGYTIPIHYDPLISKLVAHGRNRSEALQRLSRALAEYKIAGVQTTIPFFSALLEDPEFREGNLHTHFIEQQGILDRLAHPPLEDPLPYVAAALTHYLDAESKHGEENRPQGSSWRTLGRRGWKGWCP